MNILFLSRDYPPNLIGGVGVYVLEMSRLLAKAGHKVYVLTQALEYPCKYSDCGVTVFRIKPSNLRYLDPLRRILPGTVERLEYGWAVSKKIRELVRKYDIDIIESSEARFEGLWYFMFKKKPKLVIKLHTPEAVALKLDNVSAGMDYKVMSILEEWWIRRADKIICLSQAIKDLVSGFFRFSLDGAPLVPNPIDIDFFNPGNTIIDTNGSPVILYAGRLEFRKGVHVLARAVPEVLKAAPETKFIFIGKDSGMKQYLINKFKHSDCLDDVLIMDGISRYKLREMYQSCTLCVLPSLWENHPYACLEAMACGRPVIATNGGGLAEIITDGFNGLLVDPGSSKGLSENIIRLISDRRLCENLGNNARKTIEERYSPKAVAQASISVYQEALSNNVA